MHIKDIVGTVLAFVMLVALLIVMVMWEPQEHTPGLSKEQIVNGTNQQLARWSWELSEEMKRRAQ